MIRALNDRRVPQFVALYVVGGWGFVQFVDWVVEQYLLAPAITNFVVALLLLLLPAVIGLAWRFGAPGNDRWKARDAALIGANLVVAAVGLFVLFRGAEFGRAAEVRTIEDPDGNVVERVVAEPEFRRRVQQFAFANDTGDPDNDWLRIGVPYAVALDLSQDAFVTGAAPAAERFREAGLEPDEPAPVPLMRSISRAQGMEYFLAGSVEPGPGDSLVARTRLYDAETARLVAERTYSFADPLEVADRISLEIRHDLGMPDGHIDASPDLPAADMMTNVPAAYRSIAEAVTLELTGEDVPRRRATAERAVALDSTSAIAHGLRAGIAYATGDFAAFQASAAATLRYAYRLPERLRLQFQIRAQVAEGDTEAALRTARYWAEIYPGDPDAHVMLAALASRRGDTEARLAHLRAAVAVDPSRFEALESIAREQSRRAAHDSAIATLREITELRPGSVGALYELALGYRYAGRFDEAREVYERAAVIDPTDPDSYRLKAYMESQAGHVTRAGAARDEAAERVRTDEERQAIASLDETLCHRTGQFACMESAHRRRLELVPRIDGPSGALRELSGSELLRFGEEWGRGDASLARIDSLRGTVEPPLDAPLSWQEADLARSRGDLGMLRAARDTHLRRAVEVDDESAGTRARQAWLDAHVAWLEDGDCGRAVQLLETATETWGLSWPGGRRDLLRCYTELERWEDGAAEVEWTLRQWPGHPGLRLAAAEFEAARGERDAALGHLAFVLDTAWAEADTDYRPAREARALREQLAGG